LFLYAFTLGAAAFAQTTVTHSTAGDIKAFFQKKQKTVLTFVGYSGAGYEDEASMLKQAERILEEFDPAKTIVNIGATPEGIGAIYAMAKGTDFQQQASCLHKQHGTTSSFRHTSIMYFMWKIRRGADSWPESGSSRRPPKRWSRTAISSAV
jgi:hypothetical protein